MACFKCGHLTHLETRDVGVISQDLPRKQAASLICFKTVAIWEQLPSNESLCEHVPCHELDRWGGAMVRLGAQWNPFSDFDSLLRGQRFDRWMRFEESRHGL